MFSTSLSQLASTITSTLYNKTPTYNQNPCNSCHQCETFIIHRQVKIREIIQEVLYTPYFVKIREIRGRLKIFY